MNKTNFPQSGDNKKVSLANSEHNQFDYEFAKEVESEYPKVWKKGGNTRGNAAFKLWTRAREGDDAKAVTDWIKEREAWMARHKKNKRIAGVVATMKWGGINDIGEGKMKELIREEIKSEYPEKSIKTTLTKSIRKGARFIATKEIPDRDNEVVLIDGIEMESYKKNPVFLWGHKVRGDIYDVLGNTKNWDVEYDENMKKMLTFEVDYADHEKAQAAKGMHEKGMAKGVSIGFAFSPEGYQRSMSNGQPNYITKSTLREVSNVIVGANPDALAMAKSFNLLDATTEKQLIIEKNHPIYKKKLKYFRSKFLSDELCAKLGYEKTGNELLDISNIYDTLSKKLANLESTKDVPTEQAISREEALKIFNDTYKKYFN